MTVIARALHAAWNTGIEEVTPLSELDLYRGFHATWNTGIEEVIPLSQSNLYRGLHAAWNTGIESVTPMSSPDLYRALYSSWVIILMTSVNDGLEIRLLGKTLPREIYGIIGGI